MFSDMRQSTPLLDLEQGKAVYQTRESLHRAEREWPTDLRGVEIYALGVDASGVSFGYWRALQRFWVEYFKKCGAVLWDYSVLRQVPALLEQ